MATYDITVTDPTPLTAGESVTINNGAVVTITTNAWAALGHGQITITWGKLNILNSSTVSGLRIARVSNSTYSILVQGKGALEVTGDWISLGLGTGLASQILTHWDSYGDFIPAVWVETAAGSGSYDKYLNITGYTAQLTEVTMAKVGSGKYGKFFKQHGSGLVSITSGSPIVSGTDTTFSSELSVGKGITIGSATYFIQSIETDTSLTLTTNATQSISSQEYKSDKLYFGDGVNGKCPPVGANIKVPNVILSYNGNTSVAACSLTSSSGSGAVVLTTCTLARLILNSQPYQKLSLASVAMAEGMFASATIQKAVFIDCGFAQFRGGSANGVVFGGPAQIEYQVLLANCSAWKYNTNVVTVNANCTLLKLVDCEVFSIASGTIVAHSLYSSQVSGRLVVSGGLYCGTFNLGGSYSISGIELSSNLLLQNSTITYHLISLATFTTQGLLEDIYIPEGGGVWGNLISVSNSSEKLTIRRITCDADACFQYLFYANNSLYGFKMHNINCKSFRSSAIVFYYQYNNLATSILANIKLESYGSMNQKIPWSGTAIKKVHIPAYSGPAASARYDAHFHDLRQSATEGSLVLFFNGVVNATNVTFVGSAVSDGINRVYLPEVGDSVTIESPFKVLGITGFADIAVSVSGYNTTNIDLEYVIDSGTGYGAWKELTLANLQSEVVSATEGFSFKFRGTANTQSTLNYLTQIEMFTTCDDSVDYPVAKVDLELNNIVLGSSYYVFNTLTGQKLASGVASATDVVIEGLDYYSDVNVTIRVRKGSEPIHYKSFETQGILTEDGLAVWIAQVVDNIRI